MEYYILLIPFFLLRQIFIQINSFNLQLVKSYKIAPVKYDFALFGLGVNKEI